MPGSPTSPSTSPRPTLVDATAERIGHIARALRAADARELAAQRWEWDPDALVGEVMGYYGPFKWVCERAGEPIAAVGAVQLHPGVWSAWMFATDEFPKIGLYLTRFVRRRMIPSLVRLGAHRCDARSIEGHDHAHRWLRALGAVEEARLVRYGRNGEDFIVFRWDKPDVLQQAEST
ncbi:MAG: hypothetical protein RJQ08_03870 [Salinisphaeraceae bacterium]